MTNPFINIYRTKKEAFYFKNSPLNTQYIFTGVHLLPNNPTKYVQITNTPLGINLEDWICSVVDLCSGVKTDITDSFLVEELTNSDNGNPQFYWSLTNIPYDFGSGLVYLEIEQNSGELFYSNPFQITSDDEEYTSQFHYKINKTDKFQSIGLKAWFKNISRNQEITQYYESSTKNTVTVASKISKNDIYSTELMPFTTIDLLMDVLVNPYLYINEIRCNLYESPEFPDQVSQENFGSLNFIISPNSSDIFSGDYVEVVIPTLPNYSPLHYSSFHYSTG